MLSYQMSLGGGALIGLAVSLMLLWNGRVTGVSGILNGTLRPAKSDFAWRASFLFGLIAGGALLRILLPQSLESGLYRSWPTLVGAGLLVGFGTVMGGGCTSGHGICGVSRFSRRSLVATVTFMLFGILSATLYRLLLGSLP